MLRNSIMQIIASAVLAGSAMAQKPATGGAAQQAQYVTGPRGGCYEVSQGGKKKSVARSFCAPATQTTAAPAQPAAASKTQPNTARTPAPAAAAQNGGAAGTAVTKGNRTYVKGAKGGCYYLTASGRKQYVDHSMCQ